MFRTVDLSVRFCVGSEKPKEQVIASRKNDESNPRVGYVGRCWNILNVTGIFEEFDCDESLNHHGPYRNEPHLT